jgi:hypothetical protein
MLKLKALLAGMVMVGFAGGVYAAGCAAPLPKGCTCQIAGGVPVYTPKDCQKVSPLLR